MEFLWMIWYIKDQNYRMNYLMCYFVSKLSYCTISGITEMYLKIELSPDDRSFHQFLWRNSVSNEKPCEYEFSQLVFDVNASPFWPNLCHSTMLEYLKISILELQKRYYSPLTWMIAWIPSWVNQKESLYINNSRSYGTKLGCMLIHKWLSNSQVILQMIPSQDRACQLELGYNLPPIKTLGMCGWQKRVCSPLYHNL